MFDNSFEERAKAKVKSQIELIGFDLNTFYIEDPLIRRIQKEYNWTAATFNKIIKHGDSTKRVSFAIDPANDQDASLIQTQYSDYGELAHIRFELPFKKEEPPHFITVTLYSDKNRIIINEDEFSDIQSFFEFVVYLIEKTKLARTTTLKKRGCLL
ncbi:MAG: hypothetical protein ACQEUS_12720 [Bacillota bacterium]